MDPITIGLLALYPLLLLRNKSSSSSKSKYVEYKYSPEPQGSVKTDLDNYLRAIENDFELKGIRDSFMGFAFVESRYIPSAHRNEPTGYKLVYKAPSYTEPRDEFKNNPWIKDKALFNSTSGIFQMFPGNALDTFDGTGLNLDPRLLYNWKYALAFAIDFAYRLNKKYNANSWLLMRYGWSSLSLLKNYNTTSQQKAKEVKDRVINGIIQSKGNVNSLYIKPDFSKYAKYQFAGTIEYLHHF